MQTKFTWCYVYCYVWIFFGKNSNKLSFRRAVSNYLSNKLSQNSACFRKKNSKANVHEIFLKMLFIFLPQCTFSSFLNVQIFSPFSVSLVGQAVEYIDCMSEKEYPPQAKTIVDMTLKNWWWVSSKAGALGNMEYSVLAITPCSITAGSGSIWEGPMGQIEQFYIYTKCKQMTYTKLN